MANNNFNLRGVQIMMEKDDNTIDSAYLFFIDLAANSTFNALFPPVFNFELSDESTETPGTYGSISATYSGPDLFLPANDTEVRTFFLGSIYMPSTSQLAAGAQVQVTGLDSKNPDTVTKGNPSTRRPPIVQIKSSNAPADLARNNMAIGIQSELVAHSDNSTYHNLADFFVVVIMTKGDTTPGYITCNMNAGVLDCGTDNTRPIENCDVCMGVYDATLVVNTTTEKYEKDTHAVPTLPQQFQNLNMASLGNDKIFPIWWAQF